MNEHGLVAKGKKMVVTTDSSEMDGVFPNRLAGKFTAEANNQKMVSDTTYIYTKEGWLYLAVIRDLHGRKLVGMAVSEHNDKALVIAALEDTCLSIPFREVGRGFF